MPSFELIFLRFLPDASSIVHPFSSRTGALRAGCARPLVSVRLETFGISERPSSSFVADLGELRGRVVRAFRRRLQQCFDALVLLLLREVPAMEVQAVDHRNRIYVGGRTRKPG